MIDWFLWLQPPHSQLMVDGLVASFIGWVMGRHRGQRLRPREDKQQQQPINQQWRMKQFIMNGVKLIEESKQRKEKTESFWLELVRHEINERNGGAPRPSGSGRKTNEMKWSLFLWSGCVVLPLLWVMGRRPLCRRSSPFHEFHNSFHFHSFAPSLLLPRRRTTAFLSFFKSKTTIIDEINWGMKWELMDDGWSRKHITFYSVIWKES